MASRPPPLPTANASELWRTTPASEEAEELAALGQTPTTDRSVPSHLLQEAEDLAGPEVEAAIEALDRGEDLGARQVRIAEYARLNARVVHELALLEPAALERFLVERGPGVRRGQRYLQRVRVDFPREADRLLDRLVGLARQAHDEGAVNLDPEGLRVLRELAGDVDPDALLHLVEDRLAARLVADQEEPEAVVPQHLERRARHVRLGVARPGDAEPAEPAGDRLGARQVVRERVIVEEVLLHLRKVAARSRDLGDDVLDRPRTVAMAANRLRPEAEGAARPTAPPGVERHVRVQEVADEVLLDHQVAVVDVHHERQGVHVLERRPLRRALEVPVRAIAESGHLWKRPPLRDLLDGEVELAAGHELDGRRGSERALALHGDVRPDETDPEARVLALERLGHAHVVRERRRARVQHGQVVVAPQRHHVLERQPGRRRVDEPAARHERRRLREPRRIPERPDLAAR